MRAKEFITEDEDGFDQFYANCSEYFSLVNDPEDVLYRGDKAWSAPGYQMRGWVINSARKARNSPQIVHTILNKLFVEEFGKPFRDGMMCSGDRLEAQSYGTLSIIVPCNGFTLSYSPVYSDLFTDAIRDRVGHSVREYADVYDEVIEVFEDGEYVAGPDKINQAIASEHEVMLYQKNGQIFNYYSFNTAFWQNTVLPAIKKKQQRQISAKDKYWDDYEIKAAQQQAEREAEYQAFLARGGKDLVDGENI